MLKGIRVLQEQYWTIKLQSNLPYGQSASLQQIKNFFLWNSKIWILLCQDSIKEVEIEWCHCKVICSTDSNVRMTDQSQKWWVLFCYERQKIWLKEIAL